MMEAQEMNAMVDDIERVLSQIAKQLKQVTIFSEFLLDE